MHYSQHSRDEIFRTLQALIPPGSVSPCNVPDPTSVAALLTYPEAAKALCVTERTIRQFVADGKLPVVRFGRTVRIDPADLRAFINSAKRRESGDAA